MLVVAEAERASLAAQITKFFPERRETLAFVKLDWPSLLSAPSRARRHLGPGWWRVEQGVRKPAVASALAAALGDFEARFEDGGWTRALSFLKRFEDEVAHLFGAVECGAAGEVWRFDHRESFPAWLARLGMDRTAVRVRPSTGDASRLAEAVRAVVVSRPLSVAFGAYLGANGPAQEVRV